MVNVCPFFALPMKNLIFRGIYLSIVNVHTHFSDISLLQHPVPIFVSIGVCKQSSPNSPIPCICVVISYNMNSNQGKVENQKQPIAGSIVYLFASSDKVMDSVKCERNVIPDSLKVSSLVYACSTMSNVTGDFGFSCLPIGRYRIVCIIRLFSFLTDISSINFVDIFLQKAKYESNGVNFDMQPEAIDFVVKDSSIDIEVRRYL